MHSLITRRTVLAVPLLIAPVMGRADRLPSAGDAVRWAMDPTVGPVALLEYPVTRRSREERGLFLVGAGLPTEDVFFELMETAQGTSSTVAALDASSVDVATAAVGAARQLHYRSICGDSPLARVSVPGSGIVLTHIRARVDVVGDSVVFTELMMSWFSS